MISQCFEETKIIRFHYMAIKLISQCFDETKIIGKYVKCVLSILIQDQRPNLLHIKYGYIHINLEKGVAYMKTHIYGLIEIGRINNLHCDHSTKIIK